MCLFFSQFYVHKIRILSLLYSNRSMIFTQWLKSHIWLFHMPPAILLSTVAPAQHFRKVGKDPAWQGLQTAGGFHLKQLLLKEGLSRKPLWGRELRPGTEIKGGSFGWWQLQMCSPSPNKPQRHSALIAFTVGSGTITLWFLDSWPRKHYSILLQRILPFCFSHSFILLLIAPPCLPFW